MILYVDTITRKLRRSVADSREVNSIQFKRGDSAEIQIVFVADNAQVELAADSTITFGIKPDGVFDGAFLVSTSSFTKSGSGATSVYTGNPSFNTTALNTALGVDLATNNDISRLKVGVEVSWVHGVTDAITSTETIVGYVYNDVIKGDEGTPLSLPTPEEWLAANVNTAIAAAPAATRTAAGLANAEDEGKIPSSLMPTTIPASVQVTDTSGVVKTAGILGGTADGKGLVVHDGVRTGGQPVPVGYDNFHIRKSAFLANADIVAGDAVKEIGRFYLPSSWYSDGALVYIDASIALNATSYAGDEISIGVHVDGETDFVSSSPMNFGVRLFRVTSNFNAGQVIRGLAYFGLAETSSVFRVSNGSASGGVISIAGAATSALLAPATEGFNQDGGAAGTPIVVTLRAKQDAAMSGSPVVASVDLKAIQVI